MNFRSLLVLAVAALLSSRALAENEALSVTPFMPVVRENTDPDMCRAFASAWIDVFRSEKPLQETWLDLEAAIPDATVMSFPPERMRHPRAQGRFGGLYGRSYFMPIDLDGDGDTEILHLEPHEICWRYMGVRLFLVEDEGGYREAVAAHGIENPGIAFRLIEPGRDEVPAELAETLAGQPRKLIEYPPTDVIFILRHGGEFYAASGPRIPASPGPCALPSNA